MCSSCKIETHGGRVLARHVVVPLKDRVKLSKAPENARCGQHQERLVLFCLGCSELICLLCRDYGRHKGHQVDLVDHVAADYRKTLQENVKELESIQKNLSKMSKTLSDGRASLIASEPQAKQLANESFDQLEVLLKSRRAEIVEEIARRALDNLRKFEKQEEQVAACISELLYVTVEAQKACVCESNFDLLASYQTVKTRLAGALAKKEFTKQLSSLEGADRIPFTCYRDDVDSAIRLCGSFLVLQKPTIQTSIPAEIPSEEFEISWKSAGQRSDVQYHAQLTTIIAEGEQDCKWLDVHDGNANSCKVRMDSEGSYRFRVRCAVNRLNASDWSYVSLNRVKTVKFSTSRKSQNIRVASAGLIASKTAGSYAYVFGENGFTSGIHTWKILVTNLSRYLVIGVCNGLPSDYDGYFNRAGIFNVFNQGEVYVQDMSHEGSLSCGTGDIVSVVLDLNSHTVVVTNQTTGSKCSFSIPTGNYVWYPSFNMHGQGSVIELLP
eukprot:TRINITY_DN6323_c0_g1_i4.p1 TRINITY_DN6323_c0_g1~~TRINITY_DN6323_c0_g1_i4.p1  ORF type:complete len:497 (-),score=118.19 TRINITY_DN6323_c0_g1_i4:27-1517(-)